MLRTVLFAIALVVSAPLLLFGQDPFPRQDTTAQQSSAAQDSRIQVQPMDKTPVYRVNVVERTTKAVNYRHKGGTTQVNFRGTSLMPKVEGRAKVTGHTGRLAIDAKFQNLEPARNFGPEYLTYVLWAITPEGRPVNLGEVIPKDGNADLQLTTDLQAFGMILTAEPYFAVTRPSDLVVAENEVRPDTLGPEHPIEAKFDLLERGEYTIDLNPARLPATGADIKKIPTDLLEARNAVAIAQAAGAEQYAPDTLQAARDKLDQAEDYFRRKQGKTPIGTVARAAVQTAEDARLLTIRRKEEARVAAEQRAAQQREQQARAAAQTEAARAEQARLHAEQEAQQRQQAEAQRQVAEQAKAEAEQARQQAEAARQAALQQQQALAQQAEQARLQAQQAEQARVQAEQQERQMRARLIEQLNQVFQTRDTARGVVASMPDVLFDFGKATLKPGARERLAKVAGIILAYPDLRLEIDGHTDNIGSDQYNQLLSEKRAQVVRDYLAQQGVAPANIVARGFGKSAPIASNATAAGRQLNRRVELVVSGMAIGLNAVVPPPAGATPSAAGGVSGTAAGTTGTPPAPTTGTSTPGVAAPMSGAPAAPASGQQPQQQPTTTIPK